MELIRRQSRLLALGLLMTLAAVTWLPAADEAQFMRGDVNIDGGVDIADPIALLDWMFIPGAGAPPPCADSADANDDGAIDMGDVIFILSFAFVVGSDPIPPPNVCGIDPTADGLPCDTYGLCPTIGGGAVDFNQFVLDLFDQTADDSEPVEINDLTFCFDDDAAVFDALLMP